MAPSTGALGQLGATGAIWMVDGLGSPQEEVSRRVVGYGGEIDHRVDVVEMLEPQPTGVLDDHL